MEGQAVKSLVSCTLLKQVLVAIEKVSCVTRIFHQTHDKKTISNLKRPFRIETTRKSKEKAKIIIVKCR